MICEDGQHVASPNPRTEGLCVKCARPIPETLRPRDLADERRIALLAAEAGSLRAEVAESLHQYADSRTAPGGIRLGLDWVEEARQEIGDGFNYFVWLIQELLSSVEAGDQEALDVYTRAMGALQGLMIAWQRLHTR